MSEAEYSKAETEDYFYDFLKYNSDFACELISHYGSHEGEKDEEKYIIESLENAFEHLWNDWGAELVHHFEEAFYRSRDIKALQSAIKNSINK